MNKEILLILALFFSFVSPSSGFDNDPNWIDPANKSAGQKEYSRGKASQGGYFGGHDTITAEGMLLKQEVHKGDSDSGEKFNKWVENDKVIPSLRIGTHDEDSTKVAGIPLDDPPIGNTGWGGWWSHFYNPKTGKGLKGFGRPAPERAKDYVTEIKKMAGCTLGGFNNLSPASKNKAYQYFGKSLHLLQDMAVPSHTQDDIHVSQKPFEKHVSEYWDQVVNSQSFKDNVTADKYLSGNYKFTDISQYWKSLAEISSAYPSDEALYEYYRDPLSGVEWYKLNEEKLQKNIDALVPKAIMYSGGFIDSIYDYLTGQSGDPAKCQIEEYFTNPGGDHPDDRFDVSDEFYWEKEYGFSEADLAGLYMRTAMKKGKIGVWYWKRFMEFYTSAVTQYQSASQEVRDALESEFKAIGQKLDERRDYAESDWKGAPDIALFAYGFYKPSISLMLKYKESVAFMELDFDGDYPLL